MEKRSCDHINGTCVSGCQDGFIGNLCNDCKSVWCIKITKSDRLKNIELSDTDELCRITVYIHEGLNKTICSYFW